MSAYLRQFSPEMDLNSGAKIRSVLMIASSQRSGSSLLGHYLAATGKFGVPFEYFNQGNFARWKERFEVETFIDLLDAVEPLRTSSNGIFSIKCHYDQLRALGSIADLLARYGDCRFVRIRRRDLVAQAVSRTIAQQTGVWISGQKSRREPTYDRKAITRNLQIVSWQDSRWPLALSIAGTPWVEVDYEALVECPAREIRRVGEFMGIGPAEIDIPADAPLAPQGKGLSQEWAEHFRSENPRVNEAIVDAGPEPRQQLKSLISSAMPALLKRREERWSRSPNLADGIDV